MPPFIRVSTPGIWNIAPKPIIKAVIIAITPSKAAAAFTAAIALFPTLLRIRVTSAIDTNNVAKAAEFVMAFSTPLIVVNINAHPARGINIAVREPIPTKALSISPGLISNSGLSIVTIAPVKRDNAIAFAMAFSTPLIRLNTRVKPKRGIVIAANIVIATTALSISPDLMFVSGFNMLTIAAVKRDNAIAFVMAFSTPFIKLNTRVKPKRGKVIAVKASIAGKAFLALSPTLAN